MSDKATNKHSELNALLQQAKSEFDCKDFASFLSTCEKLVVQFPDHAQCHHLCGVAYIQFNQLNEAEQAFKTALSLNPKDMQSAENLGVVLDQNGWKRESYAQLRSVLQTTGKLGRSGFLALIRNALLVGDKRTAHDAVGFVLGRSPNDPAFIHLNARVAFAHHDTVGGKHVLATGLAQFPKFPEFIVDDGLYSLSAGNLVNAAQSFRQAIQLDPYHSGAHYALADMGGGATEGQKDDRNDRLDLMRAGIQSPEVPYLKQVELGFAAGKVLDSQASYDEAFTCYDDANRKVWARLPVQKAAPGQAFEDTKQVFNDRFFANLDLSDLESGAGMIFLVGMPRSGTTLLEQVLSRLPNVTAGGETGELENIVAQLPEKLKRPGIYPDVLNDVANEELHKLSGKYMAQFRSEIDAGTWRTTKDMGLYMHLGLITALFPAAKIIHCRRNPLDTCVSAYFQFFKLYHLPYTFDLLAMAEHYRSYADIMAYWTDQRRLDILQFQYEDFVVDPQSAIKQVVEFCGIEWSDDCLDFTQSDRLFKTASIWQVRQGMHQQSVDRWRRYEKHLAPLIEGINDIA